MSPRTRSSRRTKGFTLVELLIVVVILAIIAAIVVPSMTSGADDAERAQFAQSLKSIITACQLAKELNGYDIEDAATGVLPVELQPYMQPSSWERETPMGGSWDSEKSSFGFTSSVGVHYLTGDVPPDADMAEIDSLLDDGSLSTGAFRKLANDRFYFVLTD